MASDDQPQKPRWQYRFDNYKRAFLLLSDAIETMAVRDLTQLETEGVIHRFEYTWELAWKVLKDYLQNEGVVLARITPVAVIRAAFEAGIITNGSVWMKALDARNTLSHVYSHDAFERVIHDIQAHYFEIFDALYRFMMASDLQYQRDHDA